MNSRDDIVAFLKAHSDGLFEDPSSPGSFVDLDYFYDATVDDDLVERIATCPLLARLESIRIPDSSISDEGFRWLSKLSALTHLNCGSSRLTDGSAASINQMVSLESLNVSETAMGDISAQVIGTLPRLKELVMRSCRLTDAGCASLSCSQSLAYLFIQRNDLTHHCVPFLEKLPNLKVLNLVETNVPSEAVETLRSRGVHVDVS